MPDLVVMLHSKEKTPVAEEAPPLPATGLRWSPQPWGWVGLGEGMRQRPDDSGDRDGTLIYVGGRPARAGGGPLTPDHIAAALNGDSEAYRTISGMFLLLAVHKGGIDIATDRFSHIPVYANTAGDDGRVGVLSTSVEWIADLLNDPPELDRVSLAELLLWDNITFPHTTREGVRQLAPGSTHRLRCDEAGRGGLESQWLWRPHEPDRWPDKRTCIDAAVAGIESAAAEIGGAASRVGVLLSGGLDSRIVASSISNVAQVEALTYADRPNRESDSAARTAAALGIPHHVVLRDPEFYAYAFEEGQRTVGFEQNTVPCHILSIAGSDLVNELDVIVGGFGCDILLKGAYIPYSMTDVMRDWYSLGQVCPGKRIGKHNYSQAKARLPLLRPELADAALERRVAYESALRDIRPKTAEEWIGFYPISHTTSIDSMAAARRFNYDELYFHAGVVDASVMTPWAWKKGLEIMSSLGKHVAPTVARFPHADSGLPATWTYYPLRVASGFYKPQSSNRATPPNAPSWLTEGSFVHYANFFRDAPGWQKIRRDALERTDAVSIVSELVTVDVITTFNHFSADYGSLLDPAILQVIRLVNKVENEISRGTIT